ncbi:hypothetical protein QTP70_024592 [Hemibagrus guttatus]|uniref:ribonuclease H n=1 Tax=Hemibagrus guttatus TaxID=175788 RepID=A0AAE0Q7B7_9TELE|nr:hypothetical protein QTP70_024592 [Hemibagrus guttatus]
MQLVSRLEVAFATNNVTSVFLLITGEKSSMSLIDQLDEVACRDLHKNEFKNVILILRALEQVISKDEDCINQLVYRGLLVKISSIKILEILILRFGAVVIDQNVHFSLRLEAIKTINSMLDSASKEARKQMCQTDHSSMLEEFANAIIDVGDYEMQVAISEALCRMTPKKQREELAGKWFSYRSFASTFTTIRVKEFETDCRIFLNELNSYFGSSRRVFSYPCIRVFLDTTELFKPEDEHLQTFWIDFNIGTSCIGFYVNDSQETLWELINLPKEAVGSYNLQDCGDQKILSIHMSLPVCHGKITGKRVQITFHCRHDIQTALNKVYGGGNELQLMEPTKPAAFSWEDSGIPTTPIEIKNSFTSSSLTETTGRAQGSFTVQSGPRKLPLNKKSTTDAVFALRILMEKYRDGQRELHCLFVDLEKACDRVPREELWYCMGKSGVAEKYVRVVQDMYERSRTVVRCAVGQTEEFKVEVGLHQGSALSPFLFAIVMDQLSEVVRQESPWTMMFADDLLICSESREQVEENLERWRFALERRGMKVSHSKTEYVCVNEGEGSGTVRLQGEEVKKVQEFKYLGSTVQSNGECGERGKEASAGRLEWVEKGVGSSVWSFPTEDKYALINDSDTEVAQAKNIVFSESVSSNGSASSVKSFPSAKSTQKRKIRMFHSESDSYVSPGERPLLRHKPQCYYNRKKTRLKSKLKVLPLSSPSSNEEKYFKESTPKYRPQREGGQEIKGEQKLDLSHQTKESVLDSRIQDLIKNPYQTEVNLACDVGEAITNALMEDDESEAELSSGVMAAFDSFKAQLIQHFSSRYKKTETKSLKSLTDCQKTVSSLLKTVHDQRLVHLECFQNAVVQQLGLLEQNCLSLKNIEIETVGFWKSVSDTVREFCNKQQKRLDSLEFLREEVQTHQSQTEEREAMPNMVGMI